MARFSRLQVFNTITSTVLVPLYYHPDAEVVKKVISAAYQGGARVFEFTNRGDFAHEVFAEISHWIGTACPAMILGAGSVVDDGTAALYIQLGANFIVSPSLNESLAAICHQRKIAWIPGCGTLSEIHKAERLGCEIVKVFPGNEVGGPGFIKSVLAPSPWSSLMVTGGVSPEEENLKKWLDAGACCLGLGSKLMPKDIIAAGRFDKIEETVKEAILFVQAYQKQKEKN